MENYICIGNRKTALTDEQLRELGFPLPKAAGDYTIYEALQLLKEGRAREVFKPRDVLMYDDYELQIIGFDHETLADGHARPNMTVMMKNVVAKRRMNEGACRGWVDTELRNWLGKEFFAQLPKELQKEIVPVIKVTHTSNGEPIQTVDSIFLPSESELFGSAIFAAGEDGKRYEAFDTSEARVCLDEDGDSYWYWTRSSSAGSAATFAGVSSRGFPGNLGAGYAFGVPPCFTFA
jgi:hypothetical protein